MYNMILVDDEAIIREGISSCLPWEENGFCLTGVFEHGLQALEHIEAHPVDVVFSDINMPRMDGLELSRILAERFPDVTVVLLTGYDDFEYAQEALRNQVREFLLKPITRKELSETLHTLREELDRKKEGRKAHELLLSKLEESFPLLKERFLSRLVSGRIGGEALRSRGEFFNWVDWGAFYRAVLISFPSDWDDLARFSLSETLRERLNGADELFFNRREDLVLLLQEREREPLERRSLALAEEAFRFEGGSGRKLISAGCGEIVGETGAIKLSYEGADRALRYSRILGVSHILSAGDVRSRREVSPEGFDGFCRRIIRSLKEGGRKPAEEELKELMSYLERHYLTVEQLTMGFMKFHYMLNAFVHEMELFRQGEEGLFADPETFGSLEGAYAFFRESIRRIDRQIGQRRNDMLLSRIDKAKAIIAERFRESRFSLQDICHDLYLSTSQFSLLFKEGTGQTFVEYLTACRIEEAKRLLASTDLKGYEVAEKAGYTDPRYFTIIFKKQTGMTAMEYRRSRKA